MLGAPSGVALLEVLVPFLTRTVALSVTPYLAQSSRRPSRQLLRRKVLERHGR